MRIIVTAGPTREPIDAVRFITNRSTGKFGYALASALSHRHEVTLISGPTALRAPRNVRFIGVETARQMRSEVLRRFKRCDAVIMNAAVCDYRPARRRTGKLRKERASLSLDLVRNPDILADLGRRKRPGQVLIGFALETRKGLVRARRKLREKNLDAVFRNDPDALGSDVVTGCLIEADGAITEFENVLKSTFARVLEKVIRKVKDGTDG